jgi:flagellar biosynthesis/type III secretory pathway M-ring protein FliF/YscJ
MQLILGGAAGAVLLLLFVAVFLLRSRKKAHSADVTGPAALSAGEASSHASLNEPVEQQMESKLAERDALQQKLDAQALSALKIAPVITKAAEVLSKHLRDKISKESEMSAQILRTWIREEES